MKKNLLRCCYALSLCGVLLSVAHRTHAANQTATAGPIVVGGDLPYSVELRQYDFGAAPIPSLHSFVAGEHDGQWVVLAGLTNGIHGFDINESDVPEGRQNRDIWVIDPISKTTWSRSFDPAEAGSGLTELQALSIVTANSQFEQVGDTLYMVGGYGDSDPLDENARDTFDTLTAFDLPGIVDWVKGGSGAVADHMRQTSDPLFKVTGGDLYEIDGQMQLVFGQDYVGRYQGSLNGEYTKQVRTFTIQDDGTNLGFTHVGSSTPEEHFRRRDLNVYPTVVPQGDGSLEEGITVLSGVFTESRGAWTVPVEIDASSQPSQIDNGHDPLNSDGSLDSDPGVFRQGMNNYHSAKLGLFSEQSGAMHELLFGGITLMEYDPTNPGADTNGFVTDFNLPNTNQITSVVRDADGSYEQHYLGEYPELFTNEGDRMRFGSNAEFFLDHGVPTYENGVIDFDALSAGIHRLGFIYGGLIANRPHVFRVPGAVSSASGEIFEVWLTVPVPEPGSGVMLMAITAAVAAARRKA